ncbi:hypothetical protein HNP38_002311 [Chryseobacterium defluvii]|uniref:JmjC domain-containing protein n=1 Tax=Chryseobacterium defluvii TaxID=160396 RepID=A0A840KEL1_9FLAO|nr:hypothetical protein [Chryseobacterium defluvii]MBB4807015.1 hypothetical protein [Chryseobacterium defluvii]
MDSVIQLDSLENILSPITIDDFLKNVKNSAFHHFKRNKSSVNPKFGIEEYENLLWNNERILSSHLRVYNTCNQRVSPPRRRENKDLFRWAIDQYIAGNNLQIHKINKVFPVLSKLEAISTQSLFSNITIDAFLLPHVIEITTFSLLSNENKIVIQTKGSTRWKIYHQQVSDLNSNDIKHNTDYSEVILSEGEVLFIKQNHKYNVVTQDSYSIYLVINFTPYINLDYLTCLVDIIAENDITFRRSINEHNYESLHVNFNDLLIKFIEKSRSKQIQLQTINRLWVNLMTKLKPLPGYHLNNVNKINSLSVNSLISKAADIIRYQYEAGNEIHLFVPGLALVDDRDWEPGRLVFPIESFHLLKSIFSMQKKFTINDLPIIYSEESRYEVVKKLVLEGVLTLIH